MAYPGRCADRRPTALLTWLTLAASLVSADLDAAEPWLARVLRVDPDRVLVRPEPPTGDRLEPLSIPIRDGRLPRGISLGALVRVWPGSAPQPGGVLTDARLTPLDSTLGGGDRTGVRARIMYGAQRGARGNLGGGRGGR